ncbi:MAG: hypothetical protein EOO60_00345 [Hymenobacter sp.]|nr:MAG: hypothetical protein EOO60_00345 [Hymenobacter sp.]
MWIDLRQEIERARQALHLSDQVFASLPYTTNWPLLEDKIYHTFCRLQQPTVRPRWLWEAFRPGAYGLYTDDTPLETLLMFVEVEEVVWLMVNDSADKFWFYQGKRAAIQAVLNECCYLDEIYLISKKYEWLLCLNHHDVVYGIGSEMSEKLQRQGGRPVIYRDHALVATPPSSEEGH